MAEAPRSLWGLEKSFYSTVTERLSCHLWQRMKRLLYLLLIEKRPLLLYRKSSTFFSGSDQRVKREISSQLELSSSVQYLFQNKDKQQLVKGNFTSQLIPIKECTVFRSNFPSPRVSARALWSLFEPEASFHDAMLDLHRGTSDEILKFTFIKLDVPMHHLRLL